MSKSNEVSRRNFIKTTGLAAAATSSMFTAKSYARIPGANERINTALIGCGGIAGSHLAALLQLRETDNLEILAVCDVFETRAKGFQAQIWTAGGQPQVETDYKELLKIKDLDYVTICTPEHWHAQQIIDSMDQGFHVYSEKPITHAVDGAHRVLNKVRETGLKLQVGVQGMSDDSYMSANRAIRAGKLGPVVHAQIDYVRNYPIDRGPWRTGVSENLPKPSDLNWEQWLGTAPKRPWSPRRYFEWRCYSDYSGGISTDLFIHRLTRILKACSLEYPVRVSGMGGIYLWDDGRDLPDNFELMLEYPAIQEITPGMTVHVLGTMANSFQNRHLIRGKDATLEFTPTGWQIHDEHARGKPVIEEHQKTGAEDIRLHHQNLHAAIRGEEALNCPVELGVYGTTAVCGANDSWRQKKTLTWDNSKKQWES